MLLLILVLVGWFTVATAAALKGDTVERTNRVAQMYGYTVCLVAVIVALASAAAIIGAAFDRAHPLQSEFAYGVSLTSFESYRATYTRERAMFAPSDAATRDTASEATLQRHYNALVADRMAATAYRTSKTFVTSSLLFLISAGLFLVHWRWLRRFA